jgi:hypothetical protein
MKIIEALKKTKDLLRKFDDLKSKIQSHAADLDCETPTYPDQRKQVAEWVQSCGDIVKEIGKLKFALQKTNVMTPVTIELGGVFVTKSIAEWVLRRRELANLERTLWTSLTDRGLKEVQNVQITPASPVVPVRKRLYFDPQERDRKVELYRSEPSIIDATLETVNATTDLLL